MVVSGLALLLAGAGCGRSGEGGPDGDKAANPAAVAPRDWAHKVCVSLAPWRSRIADLTARAQGQIGATATPEQSKQSLVTLLAGLEEASESARDQVTRAGIPKVDDGATIAAGFSASLERARDAYGHAKGDLVALDTRDSKAFYDRVGTVFETLNNEYAASGFDPTKVSSADLQRAFAEVPECR